MPNHILETLSGQLPVLAKAAVHLPIAAVLGAALPAHHPLGFQAVEEPGDPGRLLDHPLGDGQGRNALGVGAAQDAQHVELLRRDPVRLQHPGDEAADHVRCAEQGHDALLTQGPERPRLPDLALDRALSFTHRGYSTH